MKANRIFNMRNNTSAQVGIGTLIIFIAMVLVAAVAAAVLIQTSGTLQQKAQSTGKQATQEVSSNLMVKSIEGVRAKNTATAMSATIDLLKLKVALNVGSSPVDVNQVVVSITDGTTANNLVYAGNAKSYASTGASNGSMGYFSNSAAGNLQTLLLNTTSIKSVAYSNPSHYFTVDRVRDEDSSFSQSNPVMNTGDMILLCISTASASADAANYANVGTTATSGGPKDSGLNLVPRTMVNIILTPESGVSTNADFVTPSSYGVKETVQLYP
ncbi:archaellin/type IV pilin N-terminal domain-containing protein [uncultured Methanomethylovorans sp.]|uniref:archaellin/type IV pilin N-terminal domain-containing protein n=1 Tax=uncultured Methanomethylovorans sp. TaxID=183759 RepID=UPI002AA61A97|nr:archaellin/type IV pilin N-terminal domain-containing protein [uncultured Methanomethylovorans sp.]